MTFFEIAKFIKLIETIKIKELEKDFLHAKERKLTEKEISDKIYNFDIRPLLMEINENYSSNLSHPNIEEKLNENYHRYLKELDRVSNMFSENIKNYVIQLRKNQITQQLLSPTYLPPQLSLYITEKKRKTNELGQIEENFLSNPFKNIFIDDISYTIFNRLHNIYKEDKKHNLANYSFLYEALKTDKFLICDPKDWINFLSENYDITIEKIDTRQSGKSKKTTAYEVIRDYYQKKAH